MTELCWFLFVKSKPKNRWMFNNEW